MEHTVVTDYTSLTTTGNENIKVYVRARPLANNEPVPEGMFKVSEGEEGRLSIRDPGRHLAQHEFLFDKIFWTDTTQKQLFDEVAKPVLDHCLKGHNGCCFAYGQTGSGKTYSMFGGDGDQRGIIPRAAEYAFEKISKVRDGDVAIVVSFLEMYCGEIRDLGRAYLDKKRRPGSANKTNTSDWYMQKLKNVSSRAFIGSPLQSPTKSSASQRLSNEQFQQRTHNSGSPKVADYYGDGTGLLSINEDIDGNVYVKDLTEIPVQTPDEMIDIVKEGFKIRATHETKMNAVSSRSHTVFKITIVRKDPLSGDVVSGTLNLVDLAGSERLNKSESEGQRLRETLSINTSLSALGKVAMALCSNEGFVPYRDSKLTRLLQSSLGGNSHTSVITTVHPSEGNYEECLNTMQFSNRCRNVVNMPRINYADKSKSDKHKIRRLKAEIQRLRIMIRIIIEKKNTQIAQLMASLGVAGAVLPDGRVKLQDGAVIGNTFDMSTVETEASDKLSESAATTKSSGPESQIDTLEGVDMFSASSKDLLGKGETSAKDDAGTVIPISVEACAGGDGGIGTAIVMGGSRNKNQLMERISLSQEVGTLRSQLDAERIECKRIREKNEQMDQTITALRKARQEDTKRHERVSSKDRDACHELRTTLISMRQSHKSELSQLQQHYEQEIHNVLSHTKQLQARHASEMAKAMGNQIGQSSSKKIVRIEGCDDDGVSSNASNTNGLRASLEKAHRRHIEQIVTSHREHEENLMQQYTYWVTQKEDHIKRLVRDFNEYHKFRTEEFNEIKTELSLLHEYCTKLSVVLSKVEKGEYPLRTFQLSDIHSVCIPPSHKPDETLLLNPERLTNLKREIVKVTAFVQKHSSVSGTKANVSSTETKPKSSVSLPVQTQDRPEILDAPTASLSDLSKEELIRKFCQVREYIQHGLRPEMECDITEALQSNQTIEYIKSLEQEVERAKKQVRSESDRYKQLRIAFSSQKRQLLTRTSASRHTASAAELPTFARRGSSGQKTTEILSGSKSRMRRMRPQSARPEF